MQPQVRITVNRDSVCAADDIESHECRFDAPSDSTPSSLIQSATQACKLASIAGGRATWIVEAGGPRGRAIAVVAQQWTHARLLVGEAESIEDVFAGSERALHFTYWCQADPGAVHEALLRGTELPSRYG